MKQQIELKILKNEGKIKINRFKVNNSRSSRHVNKNIFRKPYEYLETRE